MFGPGMTKPHKFQIQWLQPTTTTTTMTMTGLGLRALLASQWAQRGRQDTQDRTTEQKTSTRTRHSLSLSLSPPSPNYATFPSFSTSPILHHPLPPSWRAYWRRCSPPFCQWLGSCCWLLIQGLGGGVVVIILLLVLVVVSFCCAVGSAMIPTCSLSIPPSPPFLLLTQPHYTTHPSLSYNNYYNIYSYIYQYNNIFIYNRRTLSRSLSLSRYYASPDA